MAKAIKKKIWFKNKEVVLNRVVEEFNAGEDIIYDQAMIPDDVWCSRCYARMLNKHNLLTDKELKQLEQGLDEILALYKKGEFALKLEDEDCHTKIEDYLIERFGDTGKKIHTGRSRNDQVLVMMRWFLKRKTKFIREKSLKLALKFLDFAKKHEMVPMPGYTHMQKAMPTTVGTWMGAFAESLTDDAKLLIAIQDNIVDQNPLGSGAGYGSPFDFDRDWLSREIGFKKTQNNVIYCHNSRGKIEGLVLEACSQIMLTLNRLACDLLFFTTQEFQFFLMDDSIATGSSIMPQKKNLDVAELIRGRTATVLACRNETTMNILNKISGYHRDGQEIKRPLFLGLKYTEMSIDAMGVILENIKPNKEILMKSMLGCPGLFAAHKAFEKVKEGMTFRDAYREVGTNINKIKVTEKEISKWLKMSTHQGGTGNLQLAKIESEIKNLIKK
ncbi:MAG: argininosuccinate lyase, argininosuccinate lyase [Candidatus Peregrinibacteria bacterium GW2011_GWF2_43_17]|nr:MAG: argininosuccinate lyase, argininosuccinate lyase [Candidatus Peregrinibacteria bacterium GW2011_GWF2_43_17]HAU39356.1 argininosuccinate lyase [Candidatus Peregrinibacteria bacterium]